MLLPAMYVCSMVIVGAKGIGRPAPTIFAKVVPVPLRKACSTEPRHRLGPTYQPAYNLPSLGIKRLVKLYVD